MIFQTWALPLFLLYLSIQTSHGANPVKRLITDLFGKPGKGDYDVDIRPVIRPDRNITVHLGSSLHEVEKISQDQGQMQYRVLLTMWWNDYALRWDPREYGGVDKMHLSVNRIWTPDVDMYNSVESNIDRSGKLAVYSDGDVLWMPIAHFTGSCEHEFRSDSWLCPMVFRSLSYTSADLDLKPIQGKEVMSIEEVERNDHYTILSVEGERELVEYPCCRTPFATIRAMVRVRNKIGHPALYGK